MTRLILSQSSATAPQQGLPAPGDIVGGKYRIERTLGMGGMGAVYEVTHCVTEKRFAIKWLLAHAHDSDQAVKRFVREAQIAGRVRHPNVVEVYDIYQEPNGFFLVMELLEGESLEARIKRRGRLRAREACEILLASMEGVAAAHAAGVVHRDIKPANIFLCSTRNSEAVHTKVLDFGISRLATVPGTTELTTTRSGTVIGTPHYMAPEQMRVGTIDGRTDVYALGITLYEMLAGVRPYDAASYPDLVLKIASGSAAPLEQLAPDLPPGLAAIVQRAMAPQTDQRFRSVEEFMDALRPYAGADFEPASPRRAANGSRRFSFTAPVIAGLLAAVLAAALAILALSTPAVETAAPPTQLRPRELAVDPAPVVTETSTAAATAEQVARPAPVPPPAADVTPPPSAAGTPQPAAAAESEPADQPFAAQKPKQPAKAALARKPRKEPAQPARELQVAPQPPPDPSPEPAKAARRDRPLVHLDRDGF